MDSPAGTDTDGRSRIRRQEVVAELGKRALEAADVDRLLRDASTAVVETLAVEYSAVFERHPGGDELRFREGAGPWEDDVGAVVPVDGNSSPGRAVVSGTPVVDEDVGGDDREPGPGPFDSHDVASGVSVPIEIAGVPWGVLGVYATERREFTDDEVEFVRDVADLLGSAVENHRERGELDEVYGRISDAFFALDEEWRFTHLNDRAHELINPEGKTLVGENVWEEFPAAVERKFEEEYERAMYEQETVSFEEYYPEPLDAWFEVRAYPSETGLSVYFRDVTDRKERERTVEEYEAIVRSVADGVYVLDRDHRFQVVNDAFVEMTGYSREELLGSDAAIVSTEDGHARGLELRERLRAGDLDVAVLEERIEDADGSFVETEIRFVPLHDDDGEFRGTAGVVRDITDRKEREQELQQYERILETIDDGVYVLDSDSRFLAVNEAFATILGRDREDLVGEHASIAFSEEYVGRAEDLQREMAEGEIEIAELEEHVKTVEGDVPVVTRFSLFESDGEFGRVGVVRDVTEREERKRRLREKERRYRTLAEHFPNGIVTLFDHDLRYELAAGQGFEDVPVVPEDVEGHHFREVWDETTADALEPAFQDALGGQEQSVEVEYEGRDWVLHAAPITDDRGDVFAGMTMAQDITDRKRFEDAIRALHQTSRDLFHAESKEEVGHLVVTAAADVIGLSDCALYLHDEERGDLYPAAEATEVGVLWDDLPRVVPGEDTIVGHVYATGESVRWDDIRDSPQFIGSGTDIRSGVYAPVGDHGVVFAGSPGVGAFDDRTLQLLELLAANAEAAVDRVDRERELEESERRYRTLVENFPDGAVGLFDEDLEYTAIGGQYLDQAEIRTEDRVGNSVYDIYPDYIVEMVEPYFEAALDGESSEFEVEFQDRHLHAYTLPVENANDEIIAGMLVIQDVTERKEQERQLRERERRLEQYKKYTDDVLDAVDDVFYIVDEEGELVRWNESLTSVTGYSEGEIAGRDASEFFDGNDRETVADTIRVGFETGTVSVELELLTKSGERIPYEFSASTLEDPWGNTVLAGIGRDVSDRVERERELERTLDLLERTERIADVAGWEVDPETKEPYWSDHLFDLLDVDYDDQPTLEQALDVYHTEEDRAIVEEAVEEALETGNPFDVEARFPRPDDDVGRLRVQGEPEVEDGEVVSLRGAVQDVTEQVERERQLEKLVDRLEESNQRLEQFAYAASHDLQEPLRMVSSYLRLLRGRYDDDLDEEGEEFLEFAVDGADRMRNMIDALLEYSRVETRGAPLEPLDLDAVLDDVLEDLQVRIQETDAHVTRESLPRVEGDARQLRQLLQNLLDNAFTYSGDESPRIDITAERDGRMWVVSVHDEGIGIDADETDRIFEVFQRLHSREEYSGTGIGLALCRRIVERHGGEIWVDSVPGEGTTFSFTLPMAGDDGE